jgi:hypothetical protein
MPLGHDRAKLEAANVGMRDCGAWRSERERETVEGSLARWRGEERESERS